MGKLPNLLTLLRLALIPFIAYFAWSGEYAIAFPIFLAAALTDLADGYIARRFKLVSKFGAVLDPVADKLNMFVATVMLAWQSRIPLWLAIAIIGRDVVIVGGALAYRVVRGHLDIKPTRLSKLNTAIEFAVLLLVMAAAAGWIEATAWMPPLFVVTFVAVMASGIQYVWRWGRMAFAERRRAP
jgi:cardiolipin synthase (CMP-forming)